jgi:hypothetical protein
MNSFVKDFDHYHMMLKEVRMLCCFKTNIESNINQCALCCSLLPNPDKIKHGIGCCKDDFEPSACPKDSPILNRIGGTNRPQGPILLNCFVLVVLLVNESSIMR